MGRRRRSTASDTARASGADPLARWRIEREIGRGAMGVVYLAHDATTGEPVALKTFALAREFGADDRREAHTRFLREAEAARRLRHPDIITVLDAGGDDAQAWLAMEYAAGGSLSRHTEAAALLPLPQVLRVGARVAHALAHAHAQGIVHRDIKPANLMFDAARDAVKVTDFGTAHLADANRTRTGMVLGTPAYMAPEQLTGAGVDARSDLYALGVTLFQLLGARLPHACESIAELMHRIANQPAPDIRSLRPELPEALANVVALALEKRPELRYGAASQMAADLDALAALHEPAADAQTPPQAQVFTQSAALAEPVTRHNSRS